MVHNSNSNSNSNSTIKHNNTIYSNTPITQTCLHPSIDRSAKHIYIYIYIYSYNHKHMYNVYTYVYIYIYIYIYICLLSSSVLAQVNVSSTRRGSLRTRSVGVESSQLRARKPGRQGQTVFHISDKAHSHLLTTRQTSDLLIFASAYSHSVEYYTVLYYYILYYTILYYTCCTAHGPIIVRRNHCRSPSDTQLHERVAVLLYIIV